MLIQVQAYILALPGFPHFLFLKITTILFLVENVVFAMYIKQKSDALLLVCICSACTEVFLKKECISVDWAGWGGINQFLLSGSGNAHPTPKIIWQTYTGPCHNGVEIVGPLHEVFTEVMS